MRLSYLSILLLFILPFLLLVTMCGITLSVEGYFLHSSEKIISGLLPYRDFHFSYSPLSLFLLSFSFVALSHSILASRILILILYILTSALLYKIVLSSTKNRFYATLAVILLVSLGPTQINFLSPWVSALGTGLLFNYLFIKFIQKRMNRYLFFAGFACFLVFLSDQFAGLMMILPVVTFFAIKHARSFSTIASFVYGYMWGIILFAVYLLLNQSFAQYVYDLVRSLHFVGSYFSMPHAMHVVILQTLLLLISVAATILLFIRRRFHLLFLPIFIIALLLSTLLGINQIDNAFYVSLIGVPIALYLRYNVSTNIRVLLIILALFLVIFGFQKIATNGKLILSSNIAFYQNPRVNILLDKDVKNKLAQLISITNLHSTKQDYMYTDPQNMLLYFILERRNPISEDTNQLDSKKYYGNVLGNLVAKKVKVVLMTQKSEIPQRIKTFIKNNYNFQRLYNINIYILNS